MPQVKAIFGAVANSKAMIRFSEYAPMATALMKRIGATYDSKTYSWTFDAAFLPLIREEVERGIPIRADWCVEWPKPLDGDGRRVRGQYRYQTFPDTPAEAEALLALRAQHAPQAASTETIPEQPVEAPVQQSAPATSYIAPAAVTSGRESAGTFVIVTSNADRFGRVLVAVSSHYRQPDYEDNEDGGWYTEYREPTEDERTSARYQELAAKIAAERESEAAADARYQQQREARRQRELETIRENGDEPDWLDELFAGGSDN